LRKIDKANLGELPKSQKNWDALKAFYGFKGTEKIQMVGGHFCSNKEKKGGGFHANDVDIVPL